MRIIAGKKKGLTIKPVPTSATRPTSDKVRESLFNMIGPFFEEGFVLDLYAGSGALGIEALSRGVSKAIFVDQNGKAIRTIHENLKCARLEACAEVYRNEAKAALKALKKRKLSFSVIFLDPPYKDNTLIPKIEMIQAFQLLSKTGHIVVEHAKNVELLNKIGEVIRTKHETYGNTALSIYTFMERRES